MTKKIKAILFDLDGTLLPMDQDLFIKTYFGRLVKRLAPLGYDKERLVGAIWKGTEAMVRNTGDISNEELFWKVYTDVFGKEARRDETDFEKFYMEDFDNIKEVCGYNPRAKETIDALKALGYRTVLATNPVFPAIATKKRLGFAGLSPDDFEHITSYENSSYSKPNPDYYREILKLIGLSGEECLMVGNDVADDMVAREVGMKVFLLTDCLINKGGADISAYPNGSFAELLDYVKGLE